MTCTFTVAGSGAFPIDMLRYDSCWPLGPEDAATIQTSISEPSFRKPGWTVTITSSRPRPTGDRWASFGCTVDGADPLEAIPVGGAS